MRQFLRGNITRSPRRGGGRQNLLVDLVEGAAASISPKVASALVAGIGRNGQTIAAVIQSLEGERRGGRGRVRAGLGRFDRPRPEPGG
jgi:hypothetical protein